MGQLWDLTYLGDDDTVSECDESSADTTLPPPATHTAVLAVLGEAARVVEPPPGLVLLSSEIVTLSADSVAGHVGETLILVDVKYREVSESDKSSLTLAITANAPWQPEEEMSNSGGTMKLVTLSVIGDAIVAETEFLSTTIWPLPDAVAISVMGRGVGGEDLRAFAERLHVALLAAGNR